MITVLPVIIGISILLLAIILDLFVGDISPWKPWKRIYNLHPTVWLGNLTKALEPHFKNANAKIEKIGRRLLSSNSYSGNHCASLFWAKISLHISRCNRICNCCNNNFQVYNLHQAGNRRCRRSCQSNPRQRLSRGKKICSLLTQRP